MTREGNILDFQGNKIAPNTGTPQVTDVAKQQGLSQTLLNTPDKDALGYDAFSTVIAYSAGDIVYYENKLWKCKAGGHAAGAWDADDFDAWSVADGLDEHTVEINRGVIFDISVANAVSGTPAQYASLALALAAVPQDNQLGGITVRYIASTSGEYVQYRLMKATWSTAVSDWQGVDDEPKAGSDNVVTSGGVIGNYFTVEGYAIRTNGKIQTSDTAGARVTEYICIDGLDKVVVNGRSSNSVAAYAFYDENKDYVDGTAVYGFNYDGIDITVLKSNFPPTAKYIVVNGGNSSDSFSGITFKSLMNRCDALDTHMNDFVKNDKITTDLDDADNLHIPTTKATKDYVDENTGEFNSESLILTRNGVKIQETAFVESPNATFFVDDYSFYEPSVDEIYISTGNTNIIFKYYDGYMYVRPKIATNVYAWQVKISGNNLRDGELLELKVTSTGSDENYHVGDTVGYVLFKRVETFKENSVSSNYKTLVDGVATNINNSPKIKISLGYYDDVPYIFDGSLNLPYDIISPSVDALNAKIDNVAGHINILFIGNSYTANSVSYVPFILKNVCPNLKFKIGVLFLDGGTLAEHLANLLNDSIVGESGSTVSPQNYNYYASITNEDGAWMRAANKSITVGLQDALWDIVSIHQANAYAAQSWDDYYAPFIYRLHKELSDALGYPIKFGWDIIHGSNKTSYATDKEKYLDIAANSELVEGNTCTEIIFPYGTAVENLRTIASMQLLGDGEHHNLLVDNSHLQSGIGQMAASYAIAIKIMQEAGCTPKVISEGTYPTTEWVESINTIRSADIGTGSIGVSEDNCFLAQVAAIQAVKNPYEVTDINTYDI